MDQMYKGSLSSWTTLPQTQVSAVTRVQKRKRPDHEVGEMEEKKLLSLMPRPGRSSVIPHQGLWQSSNSHTLAFPSNLILSPLLFQAISEAVTKPEIKQEVDEDAIKLDDLPNDALRLILRECSGRSLQAIACTSTRFSQLACEDDRLWRQRCEAELPLAVLGHDSVDELLWEEDQGSANNKNSSSSNNNSNQANESGRRSTRRSGAGKKQGKGRKKPVSYHRLFTVYSRILGNDLISCTGLDLEKKNFQRELVEGMGGQYQGHLDKSVTILVVGQAGTEKYKFAKQEKIEMVTENWVRECFMERRRLDPSEYIPQIFCGLKFCATQIQAGVRAYLEDEAGRKGGGYTADLRKDHNTHLIAVRPEGRKFEFAHRWRMKVVTPAWFFACLANNEYIDELEYIIPRQ